MVLRRYPGITDRSAWNCQVFAYEILIILQLVAWSTTSPFGNSAPLYTSQHFVQSLNSTTINQRIYSSDRAWLMEFYSSWCGHCINFAPKWIQFADDLKEWRSVVVIAAIDCAEETNIPTCRQYEIVGYPTLLMFPPHSPKILRDEDGSETLNIGSPFKRTEVLDTLKTNLIQALVPMFDKFLGPKSYDFPNTGDLWRSRDFSNGPSFVLLIYEDSKAAFGTEVALRLSRYNSTVRVVRFAEKNRLYEHLALDGWPAAAYTSNAGVSGSLVLGNNPDFVDVLTTVTIQLANITKIEEKPEQASMQVPVGGTLPVNDNTEDKVSMEDLLQTIRNSLRNEVGLRRKLDGTKLGALKNYLGILSQYFPTDRREVKMFLVKLSDWVRPQREIENINYMEKLNDLEADLKPWDINLHVWHDCQPTVPGRRGYTCGLWRLFHVLTVIAYEKHEDASVLAGIHGYVKEFFGCQECSEHFGKMVDRDYALQIRPVREQMMWLWKAHNEVNMRLRGTPSEDPGYPKWYYPTHKNCPACYVAGSTDKFDQAKVEEYLVKVYSSPKRFLDRDPRSTGDQNSAGSKLRSNSTWMGGYFSLTDVGILMFLYFSIAILLVFAYIHFKVARRRRYDPIFCLQQFFSRMLRKHKYNTRAQF